MFVYMIMFIIHKISNHIKWENQLFLQRHYWSQKLWCKVLKNWQESFKDIGIYNIGYITIKKIDNSENIYSVNPLYLLIAHWDANEDIEEKGENKYLVFDSTDENTELLKKYNHVFNGIRDKIKEVIIIECGYEKDYMKIKLNSDDKRSK